MASVLNYTRRQVFERAGFTLASSLLAGQSGNAASSAYDWIRMPRTLIAEAYNPPFYPALDYEPEKALGIAKALNADSMRYPAASYFAYFPTRTRYPVHPELKGDPMKRTVELFHDAGLKMTAYVPLNHPFMDVNSENPGYANWTKRFADGKPMTTGHYGFATYYEGCLNSPLRHEIRELVREVLLQYPFDVLYFDGPYMGMNNARRFCHCKYCQEAYLKARGKTIPKQDGSDRFDDEVTYTRWMADEVVTGFLREIREMIRRERDVPVLYNDTSLLSRREWRSRSFPAVDGFMFEAAETPEDKLFNLQLGRSTGKVIWTYVSTHTQYNREHLKNERVRGWFSYPVESEELLLDGATAIAGNAGIVYWGLSRFFYMPNDPLQYESGRYVRRVFDFVEKNAGLLKTLRPFAEAGILVGSQTIDWYAGKNFVGKAYENCYHGAFQLFKDNGYDAEPFLDYQMTAERLRKYKVVYVPNAPCLSDAQCAMLTAYVEQGGALVATHLTSVADETGRPREDFGLAQVLGVKLVSPDPIEIPDLYLQMRNAPEPFPQDPQIVRFETLPGTRVVAETLDRGHRRSLGPGIVIRNTGEGRAVYIGSSLEAVYAETRMRALRDFFAIGFRDVLDAGRPYRIEFRSGLMPHFASGGNSLVLHLLADTGNKWKKYRAREEFVPLTGVKAAIRIPPGREPKSVSLLNSGATPVWEKRGEWIEVTVPQVAIYEAVHVVVG